MSKKKQNDFKYIKALGFNRKGLKSVVFPKTDRFSGKLKVVLLYFSTCEVTGNYEKKKIRR